MREKHEIKIIPPATVAPTKGVVKKELHKMDSCPGLWGTRNAQGLVHLMTSVLGDTTCPFSISPAPCQTKWLLVFLLQLQMCPPTGTSRQNVFIGQIQFVLGAHQIHSTHPIMLRDSYRGPGRSYDFWGPSEAGGMSQVPALPMLPPLGDVQRPTQAIT